MIILTLRTDKPDAEIGLFNDKEKLNYIVWQAHRQLAETLHSKIKQILQQQNKDWHDIGGVVCYQGPGSFTGLRIGLTVANTLATELSVPIVATTGDNWLNQGTKMIINGKDQKIVLPEYGAPVHITKPRK